MSLLWQNNHNTADCRVIAKAKQRKIGHSETKAVPGKKSLAFLFEEINLLKKQLNTKIPNSKKRKVESLLSTEINLLILTNKGFNDHLTKLEIVLARLSTAGMRVNASKSKFLQKKLNTWATGLPEMESSQFKVRWKPFSKSRLQKPEKNYATLLA